MERRLWDRVRSAMERHPGQVLADGDVRVSYEEAVRFAEGLAKELTAGLYAIRCASELDTALALLACFCAGVTAIPLSDRYGSVHCERILTASDADCLITDRSGALEVVPRRSSSGVEAVDEPPALILYTSGTAGVPKGAMLSERNILANLDSIGEYFGLEADDCIMIARPLYHGAVLTGELLMALLRGARVVFCSEPFHPFVWGNCVSGERVSVLGGTPTLFFHFSRLMRRTDKLTSIGKLVVSGERLSASVAAELRQTFPRADVYSVYGLTEASPRVAALPPSLFDAHPESCGFPIKGVTVRIVNEDGREVPTGELGELQVRGDNVMMGYYKDPAATAKALAGGWLRTGDIAYRDEAGLIYIKGRRDDMIIRAGINIYPQEIEAVASEFPGISGVVVRGEADARFGQRLVMLITGSLTDPSPFRAFCRTRLPDYAFPDEIRLVDTLPKTASGKKHRL